jgi:Transglycosylase SLT domain
MSLLTQIALAIMAINPIMPAPQVRELSAVVIEQSMDKSIDPWLIVELVRKETHWIPSAVRHETDGTCSVGLGQINTSCALEHMRPLLDPVTNLRRTASILAAAKRACREDCGGGMWLRAYNPGDSAYAPAILAAVAAHGAKRGASPNGAKTPMGKHQTRKFSSISK